VAKAAVAVGALALCLSLAAACRLLSTGFVVVYQHRAESQDADSAAPLRADHDMVCRRLSASA